MSKADQFALSTWNEVDWSASPLGCPSAWSDRLRSTVELMTAAEAQIVMFWGPQFVALYNDAYAPTIGTKHPVALGRPAQENWTELWDDLEPLLRGVRETGKTFSAKARPFYIERQGFGETVYFDISYSAVKDDDGSVGGVLCIVAETTEQVLAEKRLKDKAHRSLELLNEVGAALAGEHELDRLVQMVTDAGVELSEAGFGAFFYNVVDSKGESYTLYSLSGAPREAFANFPMPRNTEVFAPTFNGTGIVRSDDITADSRYGRNAPRSGMPEGHLPVRSYLAVPVSASNGEVLGGLFFGHSDVGRFTAFHEKFVASLASQAAVAIENARLIRQVRDANEGLERRVAERTEELARLHETLRQSQKMEAIGQLTGGVAHDFNNLLTVISGATEMLRKPDLPEEKRQRYLDGLTDTVKRASTLTGHLLAFSRRRIIQPQVIDLNIQIDALGEMLSRSIESSVAIVVKSSTHNARVEVDPTELETAILNAAVNARDAMPDGGTLTIEIRDYTQGHDNAVAIDITDTGIGMAEGAIEHAFEPFYTTKPVGHGTGLGLSQIHGFAAQAGGSAEILSKVGVGTTLRIRLPRVDKQPASGRRPDARASLPSGLRVLLVEDNLQVLEFAEQLLEDLGLDVVKAQNAHDALRIQQEHTFDLVFSDVVMPGLSGIDLARQLHVREPDLPVLLATGYSEQMVGEGAASFTVIAKPYGAESLTRAIRGLLPVDGTVS